jgi:hypothetical protein
MAATQRQTQADSPAPLRARLPGVRPPAPPPPPPAAPEPPPPPAPPPASAPPRPPTAPELKPAAGRMDLDATPLTRAAFPPGAKLLVGRLVRQVARNGRPLVGLEVPCQCRFRRHRYPWRGDWPVSREVASFQLSVCPGRKGQAVWLALDPATLDEQEATMRQARAAFTVWQQARAERQARKAAGTAQPHTEATPGPNP